MKLLVLTQADIRRVFSMADAIQADKDAMATWSKGESIVPLRTTFKVEKYGGTNQYMPAYDAGADAMGVKIVSTFPGNVEKGLPTIPSLVVMVDAATGQPQALLDGTFLTRFRTGALSGAATDLLARQDSRVAGMFGYGGQAECQAEAVLTARPQLEEYRVYGRNRARLEAFVAKMTETFAGKFAARFVAAASPEETVRDADVLTLVTTASQPVLDGAWLKPGVHINAVGSYQPHTREIDDTTVQRADRIYVDTRDGCLHEAGDLILPIQSGKLNPDTVAELGELILGKVPGRQSPQEITLFKTVGFGGLDVVNGKRIVDCALAQGGVASIEL